MKRLSLLCFCLIVLMLFAYGACAEEALPIDAAALFQSAFPGSSVMLADRCGSTAAAVLSDGKTQALCLAEEKNGIWELVAANPTALNQNTPVTGLLLDTEDTLFWSCDTDAFETYHAVRENGQWCVKGITRSETHPNGNISEAQLSYAEGLLYYNTYFSDENENILSSRQYMPVPAAWLDEMALLNRYDDARFPKPDSYYTHSWLSEEATALAADELFPGYTFLGGCAKQNHLEFFLEKPNAERIIAACRFDEEGIWRISLSTPLPADTAYGFENFSSSLHIGDLLVNIGPVDEAACGVTFIYNTTDMASGESMFGLGKNWIADESSNGHGSRFGDHPWSDVTVLDWNSLPHSLEEALAVLDPAGWAVVNNPNPADRLHLRAKPDRSAESMGKYYNGTPVRILDTKGSWVQVDIFGVSGWMLKEYLAVGADGHKVEAVFPDRMAVENKIDHFVYAQPEAGRPIANYRQAQHELLVLAVLGDEWYHVWFPHDHLTGYVLQSDWWEGNG